MLPFTKIRSFENIQKLCGALNQNFNYKVFTLAVSKFADECLYNDMKRFTLAVIIVIHLSYISF